MPEIQNDCVSGKEECRNYNTPTYSHMKSHMNSVQQASQKSFSSWVSFGWMWNGTAQTSRTQDKCFTQTRKETRLLKCNWNNNPIDNDNLWIVQYCTLFTHNERAIRRERKMTQRNSIFSNQAKHACKVSSADCNIPRTR